MRIPLSCMQCFTEQGQPDTVIYPAELQDNGLYRMECRNGHETITCLQEQKFELLFDLAVNAIIDGYYREAVTSFTSSAERFYEFYLKVISIKRGVSEEAFSNSWGKVSSQSERQLGAYIFLYTVEKGELPPLLSNSKITFRNDVIHKGKIPTNEEAVSYGKAVLESLHPVLLDLKVNESDHVSAVVLRHVGNLRKQIKGVNQVSFMSAGTIISIARADTEPQPTLDEIIARYTERRARAGW